MHTLQVGPAMALAGENPIKGTVDLASFLAPELHGSRVHPWMHAGWHQPQAVLNEQIVRIVDLGRETLGCAL